MRRGVVLLLLALVTTTVLFAGSPAAFAAAERVPAGKLSSAQTDVEVFMAVGATKAQINAVERRIRTSTQVRRYSHLDRQDSMAKFERIFKKNPDLLASVKEADLPESFPVDLVRADDTRVFARTMRKLPGVESAARTPTEAELLRPCQVADVEIFMKVAATQAEIDGATAAVAAEPGLTVTRVLSKDDAYAEFRRIFVSNPDLVNSISAAELPVSIRVQTAAAVSDDLTRRLRALPGVEEVGTPGPLCDAIRALLARGRRITPEALARLLAEYGGGLPG